MQRKSSRQLVGPTTEAGELRDQAHTEASQLRRQRRDRLLSSKRVRLQEQLEHEHEHEHECSEEEVQQLRNAMLTHDREAITQALHRLHHVVARPSAAVRRFVLEGDAMHFLGTFLQSPVPEHQLQTLWCLSNIAAGSTELCHRSLATAPYVLQLLQSANQHIQEQSAYVLGNIAADTDPGNQKTLIANGIVYPLVEILRPIRQSAALVVAACFAVANMLRRNHADARLFMSAGVLPLLLNHLHSPDPYVAAEVAWALSFVLAEDEYNSHLLVTSTTVIPALVQLLHLVHSTAAASAALALPAIRTLANLVAIDDLAASALFQTAGFLDLVKHFLSCTSSRAVVKETLWLLGNLTSTRIEHIQQVEQADVLTPVIALFLGPDDESDAIAVRKEAAIIVANVAILQGEHMAFLLEHGLVQGALSLTHNKAMDIEAISLGLQLLELVHRSQPDRVRNLQLPASLPPTLADFFEKK